MDKRRYYHLVEKPSMCGPTCIQMILLRYGIWMDQEDIAEKVNARILPNEKDFFSTKLKVTKNSREAGIYLREFGERRMRDFFKNLKPSLKSEVFRVNELKNVKDFIQENLNKDNDIIANFHMGYFDKKRTFGHFVLISGLEVDTVTFCDPEPKSQCFWTAPLVKLVKSMDKNFDGTERGFAILMKS